MTEEQKKLSKELEDYMAYCTGTEHYYKAMFGRFVYTDGVKAFAEKAGAYWFIDLVSGVVCTQPKMHSDLISICLDVTEDEKAVVTFRNCKKMLKKQTIPYTDCPVGRWMFYFYNEVFLWYMEY